MDRLKLGDKMREIPTKEEERAKHTISPNRQAWLDVAEAFDQLKEGFIDRFEFNLRWAEFMYKKDVLRQRKEKQSVEL